MGQYTYYRRIFIDEVGHILSKAGGLFGTFPCALPSPSIIRKGESDVRKQLN